MMPIPAMGECLGTRKVRPGRLETCWSCGRPVFLAERLVAGGKLRHRTCFTCKRCGQQMNLIGSYETEEGDFVCETCPDEERKMEPGGEGVEPGRDADEGGERGLTIEEALGALLRNRADAVRSKFLGDPIGGGPGGSERSPDSQSNRGGCARSGGEFTDAGKAADSETGTRGGGRSDGRRRKSKNLNELTYGDLAALNGSADDIRKEVSRVIDEIIEEAMRRLNKAGEVEAPEIGEEDAPEEGAGDPDRSLNPFADDLEEEEEEPPAAESRRPPVPAERRRQEKQVAYNRDGQKIIEAPAIRLNPFWSDLEESSEDESSKPIPAPRTTLRSRFGSNTSLNSLSSSASTCRRKKGPAPQPPARKDSLGSPPGPEAGALSRPGLSPHRSHRKSKPAPPPPPARRELSAEKKEKNYENKVKQNMSAPDKSTYGKWKRKKGQAPSLPIPQRRRITPLPLPDLYRELEDLEVQQRELERQGVGVEQTIRQYESEVADLGDDGGRDVEGLILQLFEIVNQKNELFRRQAELMYLRRQQRLEEEHADIEYQIRCLMGRPERNKTDSDKAQEEELIRRLVEVVERRNEIVECLDMDRKREVEEDRSIHHHLEVFAGKATLEEPPKRSPKGAGTLLKLIKKKKSKKDKSKDAAVKARRDADKDIDEAAKEEDGRQQKTKKKWFSKP